MGGGDGRNRTDDRGFADPRLNHLATSPQKMERKTRFELATPSLARRCSTTEPLPPASLSHSIFTTSPIWTSMHCPTVICSSSRNGSAGR
jgi:hypothetical protein